MTEKCEPQPIAPALRLQRHLKVAAVVSALYVWAYFMTVTVVAPVQGMLLPSVIMSLLFLPHGVRVLAAWIYGWRSVLYLVPGAVLCNLHFAGDRAFAPAILLGTLASLLAAPVAFALARWRFGAGVVTVGRARLQTVIGVGFAASVLNLTALKLIFGLQALEGAVIFVGDTSGLIVAMLIVWGTLRLMGRRI